jgi:hypothetical protein
MLDEDSAIRLGDRKLGELSDMVSQFEVSACVYADITTEKGPYASLTSNTAISSSGSTTGRKGFRHISPSI